METVEKSHKRKRKRGESDKSKEASDSSEGDRDLHHRSKRVHQPSSTDQDDTFSIEQHEEMLDTVSGHIQELKIKEVNMDGDSRTSKQTKAAAKSKKTKNKQTGSLKLDENGEGTSLDDDVKSSAQMENRTVTDISSSGVSQESALEYLRLWMEERERWSFKKKTQYWLLQNMYDRTKVPKSGFKIMLHYLSGLQGRQRELSVQKAQKIVEQYGEEGSSTSRRHYKRAVAIMRVLG